MKSKSILFKVLAFSMLAIFLMSGLSGCKKISDTIEEVWEGYWAGVFDLGEGWQVELEGDKATFVTAGTNKIGLKAGDSFTIGMTPTGNNKWRGYVRNNNGFGYLVWGNAEIIDSKLKITPDGSSSYTINKGVKNTGTGGTGGGIVSTAQVLINQKVEGEKGDKKIFKITIPTGVKQMEIRTTEVAGVYYYNLADLFVRRGSDPTVSLTPQYSWTADWHSVNPNREDEVILVTNPPAGVYHIMLYGYNSYFTSQLVVKIVK
ncbi:MAG: hypothetical protein B7X86_14505 [Sphingobacteriales bacterium 17-39-43]|uniref:hypothetical protein n=1 Tax=Daejeonella sp. TaxID=2805397 RepID=UPI000BD895FA|nr:hypothetical protein [Daejeonella sp.]OYZ29853.1 MAG: hypothetical protein B7Y24_14270 [Sphingobacteriales bacterium 16-39-50]OYZ59807.1 MAG: hypothetical protein B7Y19_00720 [Sphingobacteriales bacterium 24-40-4]OZA22751.1 MAG: hypothetical protein B7X86_14505 [Sphingobacteriales bacterium 17-39-43]HQS04291.1 hypothetical protein [Daejeonella sp.]HQT24334.1 hypothetical protein [Daejeonella sp.]